jgi:hypothetical protein
VHERWPLHARTALHHATAHHFSPMPDQPHSVRLRVVTAAPARCKSFAAGCTCPACKARIKLIAAQRASCPACHGDPQRCIEGTSSDDGFTYEGERLPGCRAWTDEGKLRPLPAKAAPKQPWDVRPARKAA